MLQLRVKNSRVNQHELTGYLDIETYHIEIPKTCLVCSEYIKNVQFTHVKNQSLLTVRERGI